MNLLYTIVAILAAIALIGSIVPSLQQISAIIVNWREEFRVLTDEFEDAISDEVDLESPDPERIQTLVDDYKNNLTNIFEPVEHDNNGIDLMENMTQ